MAEEMIVFTRCNDLLAWLMPKAEKFPVVSQSDFCRREVIPTS